MLLVICLFILSFLIGSIPIGYVIGRLHGIDIRAHGSGNIGATNLKRTLGKKAGVYTLIGDILKGFVSVSLPTIVALFGIDATSAVEFIPILGLLTILGHCFSPFLSFKGGKGVATSLGVFILLAPIETLVSLVIFVSVVIKSGFVSLGSISAAVGVAFLVVLQLFTKHSLCFQITAPLIALLIIYRHKENITRLRAGEELSYKAPKENTP